MTTCSSFRNFPDEGSRNKDWGGRKLSATADELRQCSSPKATTSAPNKMQHQSSLAANRSSTGFFLPPLLDIPNTESQICDLPAASGKSTCMSSSTRSLDSLESLRQTTCSKGKPQPQQAGGAAGEFQQHNPISDSMTTRSSEKAGGEAGWTRLRQAQSRGRPLLTHEEGSFRRASTDTATRKVPQKSRTLTSIPSRNGNRDSARRSLDSMILPPNSTILSPITPPAVDENRKLQHAGSYRNFIPVATVRKSRRSSMMELDKSCSLREYSSSSSLRNVGLNGDVANSGTSAPFRYSITSSSNKNNNAAAKPGGRLALVTMDLLSSQRKNSNRLAQKDKSTTPPGSKMSATGDETRLSCSSDEGGSSVGSPKTTEVLSPGRLKIPRIKTTPATPTQKSSITGGKDTIFLDGAAPDSRDPRKQASKFEEVLQSVFDLSPRSGKDKFERTLERLDNEERVRFQEDREAALRSEQEKALQREEELRHAREPDSTRAKPTSGFAGILKRASNRLIQQRRATRGSAAAAAGEQEGGGGALVSSQTAAKPSFSTERDDVLMERRLEAVYVSFALFGKWDPDAMVVRQKCSGMAYVRFQLLCEAAGLLGRRVSGAALRRIFEAHTDKGTAHTIMSFPNFVCALEAVAKEGNARPAIVYRAVSALNVEQRLCVHAHCL